MLCNPEQMKLRPTAASKSKTPEVVVDEVQVARRDATSEVPLYAVSNLYLSAAGLGPIQSQWLL